MCHFVPAVLFCKLADVHVISRHFGMESCANRAFLETVNSESTACGQWAKLRLPW